MSVDNWRNRMLSNDNNNVVDAALASNDNNCNNNNNGEKRFAGFSLTQYRNVIPLALIFFAMYLIVASPLLYSFTNWILIKMGLKMNNADGSFKRGILLLPLFIHGVVFFLITWGVLAIIGATAPNGFPSIVHSKKKPALNNNNNLNNNICM